MGVLLFRRDEFNWFCDDIRNNIPEGASFSYAYLLQNLCLNVYCLNRGVTLFTSVTFIDCQVSFEFHSRKKKLYSHKYDQSDVGSMPSSSFLTVDSKDS